MLCALGGRAATITVTSAADSGAGSLRAALAAANPGDTIAFSLPANSTIALSSELPVISQNLTIDGSGSTGLTVSGNGGSRVFFVNSGTVSISNLAISNGLAQGGAGGNGGAGGGGGAGAGGAIFVGSSAAVSVQNVSFSGNSAVGGAGGTTSGTGLGGGGGGGLGGNGGNGAAAGASPVGSGGGGGGVGLGATGGSPSTGGAGSAGILTGAGPGGSSVNGTPGGANAGGGSTGAVGGNFSSGGGGGANGTSSAGAGGASGGFGGGGGGGVDIVGVSGYEGGNGGVFGGGAGSGTDANGLKFGGKGGFGGGAGGGSGTTSGGFSGGGTSSLSGGGGAGLGGAVFVSQGGSFTVNDGGFSSNTVAGGAAGGTGAAAGVGVGGAMFLMGSNATYNVSNGNTVVIDNTIGDGGNAGFAGTFTKGGAGTLTFTANNTYTGQTTISGGVLQIGNGGTTGAILGDVVNNSSLVFNRSNTLTYGGTISGSGGVTQAGGGVLTLSGTNSYMGGTTINSGTLAISADANLGDAAGSVTFNGGILQTLSSITTSRPIALNGTGTILTNSLTTNIFSGAITGAGGLTKTGLGTLILTGNNSYSGNTVINVGILQVGNGGTTGNISGTVMDNGSLIFARADQVNFGGTISGTGSVTQMGGSVLQLTGTNTYSGGTKILGGTLAISSDTNLGAASGPLTFGSGATLLTLAGITSNRAVTLNEGGGVIDTNNFDSTLNGAISGSGSLTKNGSGTLTLKGAGSYSGGTSINAGTIAVGNPKALGTGDVNVSEAGTLEATGSAKTIQIGGNYSQGGGSQPLLVGPRVPSFGGTLNLRLGGPAPGQYDSLHIAGSATLGGTLNLLSLNGFSPRPGDFFTLITAAKGITGTFATVNQPDFALKLNIAYLTNAVDGSIPGVPGNPGTPGQPGTGGGGGGVGVSVEQVPFTDFAKTPNQMSVARNLDKVIFDSRANKLVGFLDSLPTRSLPGAFDQIAPADLTAIFQTAVSLANIQTLNIERRLEDLRAGARGFDSTHFSLSGQPQVLDGVASLSKDNRDEKDDKDGKKVIQVIPESRWGAFITGQGEFTSVRNGDTNARGYDLDTGGFTLGADYRVNDHLIVGIDAGYAHTRADLNQGGSIDTDGAKFGAYATAYSGGWHADLALSGGYNSYSARRAALLGSAHGDTDGTEFNVLVATGYDIHKGALTFGPVASFQYTNVGLQSFTEHGSLAPLFYPHQNEESLRTNLGMQMSYECKVGHVLVYPRVRVTWQHEYDSSSFALDSEFASGAGNLFTVHGPRIGRDSAVISAGIAVRWNDRVMTYADYDGEEFRSNYNSQNVSAGMSIAF